MSATIPNCVSYDPTYNFELAVIIREGLRRMITEQEDVFYYLTLMNENYQHPAMPEGAEEGILRGLYLLRGAENAQGPAAGLGHDPARGASRARTCCARTSGSRPTSGASRRFTELRREGMEAERWNTLHPGEERARAPGSSEQLGGRPGPVIAATDYMRSFADQIRPWVDAPYRVLGTDGYGRSDYRKTLRSFFEVDRHHVALAALTELAKTGEVDADAPKKAIESYGIDTERPAPWRV